METSIAPVELACATDKERAGLKYVQIDPQRQRLVAADGFIMAIAPMQLEDSESLPAPRLIHGDVLRSLRRTSRKAPIVKGLRKIGVLQDQAALDLSGEAVPGGNPFAGEDVRFPAIDYITKSARGARFAFALDVNRLQQLAQAISTPTKTKRGEHEKLIVQLYSTDFKSIIVVKPNDDNGAVGIIMPAHAKGIVGGEAVRGLELILPLEVKV